MLLTFLESIELVREIIETIDSVEFVDIEEAYHHDEGGFVISSSRKKDPSLFAGYGLCIGGEYGVAYIFPEQDSVAIRYLTNIGLEPHEAMEVIRLWSEYTDRSISVTYRGMEIELIRPEK